MKRSFLAYGLPLLFSGLLSLAGLPAATAQNITDAGAYMGYISGQYREILKDYVGYSSAVAHGKNARKIENRRQELIRTTNDARRKITAMPPFEGDKSFRDSTAKFLLISYHLLNDDYGKIVNLEEVAEQSYDAMEAYLMAQQLANEKLDQAKARLDATEKAFAGKNNVRLLETKDDLARKAEKTTQINSYYHPLYLIFFKSYKQEMYLLDAVQKKNVNAVEQNKNTLVKYAEAGLGQLDTLPGMYGDRSVVNACRQLLEFYRDECRQQMPALTGFYLKEENFTKIQQAMTAKRGRTQADIDQYNRAADEMNQAGNAFNRTNGQLFESRKKLLDNWNKTVAAFFDKHVPKYKE
ncbi:MAG: hypothetical protein H7Z75_22595 [Ferruginibacter sp.]|nr:hypothetical protein [Cytophagales bacterium]